AVAQGYGLGTPGPPGNREMHAHGESLGGGSVDVEGIVGAGESLSGVRVALDDSVTGETSGDLKLLQEAYGGDGRESGGSASSVLTHEGSSSFITLNAAANGGRLTYTGDPNSPSAPTDASATAVADARNHVGGVSVGASSLGGNDASSGASASSDAYGESHGDGEAAQVLVGASSQGGRGLFLARITPDGSRGGDARSTARGAAFGNAKVSVDASALGGSGGYTPYPLGSGGAGGDARADAFAVGGASSVSAAARATAGGTGSGAFGSPYRSAGPEGAAIAYSSASGLGEVVATSEAFSERSVLATSESTRAAGAVTGLSASRSAQVVPSMQFISITTQSAFGSVPQLPQYLAQIASPFFGSTPGENGTSAFAGLDATTAASWLVSSPHVADAIADRGELLGIGTIAMAASSALSSSKFEFDLAPLAKGESLSLGWLDVPTSPLFDLLHIALFANGTQVFDETVEAENAASLDDVVIRIALADLGIPVVLQVDVDAKFTTGNTAIYTDFALFASHVPEPELSALILVGVAVLALRRSMRSP
ncbi:MAG TPA: hypothetical protein VKF60_08840, partial [Myxococcota bacterium]|nr:hypothetical protein [Myxococcota bacterium]